MYKIWGQPNSKIRLAIVLSFLVLVAGIFIIYSDHTKKTEANRTTQQYVNASIDKHNYGEAKRYLIKLIDKTQSKSKKSDLYLQLGNVYYDMDSPAKAIEAYEKAAEANKMTHTIAKQIATSYLKEGDKEKTVEYLQMAIVLWPKDDPLYQAEVSSLQQAVKNLKRKAE